MFRSLIQQMVHYYVSSECIVFSCIIISFFHYFIFRFHSFIAAQFHNYVASISA